MSGKSLAGLGLFAVRGWTERRTWFTTRGATREGRRLVVLSEIPRLQEAAVAIRDGGCNSLGGLLEISCKSMAGASIEDFSLEEFSTLS